MTWEIRSPQMLLRRSWFDLVTSACSVEDTFAGASEDLAVIYTCPHTTLEHQTVLFHSYLVVSSWCPAALERRQEQ